MTEENWIEDIYESHCRPIIDSKLAGIKTMTTYAVILHFLSLLTIIVLNIVLLSKFHYKA